MWWLCPLSIHWSRRTSRELGFLFLIYIIRAEHSHLIKQLAQASTDTQSYSRLSSIPQRQRREDACYTEPYAWQRLNYHQAFIEERERTIFSYIYYRTVCLNQTGPYAPACLNTHACMWDSLRLVKERFSYTNCCSKAKTLQSDWKDWKDTLPRFLTLPVSKTFCWTSVYRDVPFCLLRPPPHSINKAWKCLLPRFWKESCENVFLVVLGKKQTTCSSGSNTRRTNQEPREDQRNNYLPCLKGEIYFY